MDADFQFPLTEVIRAGFNRNPLILDMVDIVECRALQDLKWKARLEISHGVFMIGMSFLEGMIMPADCQVWLTKLGH